MERIVAIINYNTPELTEAAIKSLRKHGGENYKIVVWDNSDEKPLKKKIKGVRRIDNTKGQKINFDKELAKFPDREPQHAEVNDWGSWRHIVTVQALWDELNAPFLLMESDVLLKRNVDFMFQENQCCVGHIQEPQPGNKFNIGRLVPMLCFFNVPLCKAGGARYYDPNRCWMINKGLDNVANWYDTGASFLEDIRTLKPQCHGKRIDIRPLMVHYGSGSWRRKEGAAAWLKMFEALWR